MLLRYAFGVVFTVCERFPHCGRSLEAVCVRRMLFTGTLKSIGLAPITHQGLTRFSLGNWCGDFPLSALISSLLHHDSTSPLTPTLQPLPYYACDRGSLEQLMGTNFPYLRDGLLFFHKEATYVIWVRPVHAGTVHERASHISAAILAHCFRV